MEQAFTLAAPSKLPSARGRTRALVEKARESALAAVAAYNNPLAGFKSGTYVVLMHVAWTSLLLAILRRRGVTKPYYRRGGTRRFETVDGRPKVWDLRECVKHCWGPADDAVSQNLRFFIGLRNRIEHTDAPEVDLEIFGECQSLLFNFEDFLEQEFGPKFALHTSLALSLQFSRSMTKESQQAIRKKLRLVPRDVRRFVDDFRGSLGTEILNDMKYSHKVFLIPMVGNRRSADALAVEFVPYDPTDPDQERVVALIKPRAVSVSNRDMLKASSVIAQVSAAIAPKRLHVNLHAAACRYWEVRPPKGSTDLEACDSRYCAYDKPHGDYLYTPQWVQFLIEQLQNDEVYAKVVSEFRQRRRPIVPGFLQANPT